jgi:hypothetical protein
MEISSQRREHVFVPVPAAPVAEAALITGSVALAFLELHADPDGTTTWLPSRWEPGASPPTIRTLVGPGGPPAAALPAGDYRPWVKLSGGSIDHEIPAFPAPGRLRVV